MDKHQEAHDIIGMFGTPDDSAEELLELLLQNDIPEDIAKEVVSDVRG